MEKKVLLFLTYALVLMPAIRGQVKVAVTQRGMDYAASQAVSILARKISSATINNIEGKSGRVDYALSDIKVTQFRNPSSSVTIKQGQGVTMSLSKGYISVSGNWRYLYTLWFIKIRDSNSFTASADGISISVSVQLDRNERGAPTIRTTGCTCSATSLNFSMKGFWSWLYELILKSYKGAIQSTLENLACREAQNAINNNGVSQLVTLNMQARINDYLTLDYSLISSPTFGSNYIETNHVGRFLGDTVADPSRLMAISTDRMASVSISESTLNSASRVLQKNNRITYSREFSAASVQNLFRNLIGSSSNFYPGLKLRLNMRAITAPLVFINPGLYGITLTANVEGKFDFLSTDGSAVSNITVGLSINLQGRAGLDAEKLTGPVSNFTADLTSISLTGANPDIISDIVVQMRATILEALNNYLQQGLPLPNVRGVKFPNAIIIYNNGHLIVSSDVTYQP